MTEPCRARQSRAPAGGGRSTTRAGRSAGAVGSVVGFPSMLTPPDSIHHRARASLMPAATKRSSTLVTSIQPSHRVRRTSAAREATDRGLLPAPARVSSGPVGRLRPTLSLQLRCVGSGADQRAHVLAADQEFVDGLQSEILGAPITSAGAAAPGDLVDMADIPLVSCVVLGVCAPRRATPG